MTLHWEATAPGVREAFAAVSGILTRESGVGGGWYLAGGTALALQEGHRISVDLDFFAPAVDVEAVVTALGREFADVEVLSVGREIVYATLGGVQLSFIGTPHPLLRPPLGTGEGLVGLASRDDLGAMKLAALASRGSRKDFVDLWILVTRHEPLAHYLDAYRRKYTIRNLGHVLKSLVYFDDAEAEPPLRLLVPIDWKNLRRDFERWAGEALTSG